VGKGRRIWRLFLFGVLAGKDRLTSPSRRGA
jgi:hypothetical protein